MIILASQSPRRRELMKYITDDFEVRVSNVDESLPDGISPRQAVEHLSCIKAEPFRNEDNIVIGADTVVAVDARILGKPADETEAREMLKMLSGKVHSVFTGVTVLKGSYTDTFSVETKVKFFELSDEDIDRYIATSEYKDKAGAYGIQGYGSLLIEGIEGDYFNVVGLPVSQLNKHICLLSK